MWKILMPVLLRILSKYVNQQINGGGLKHLGEITPTQKSG